MTEEERRAVIEKAARAMQPEHFDMLTDRMREGVRDEARRALTAVDHFTLRAALTAAKELNDANDDLVSRAVSRATADIMDMIDDVVEEIRSEREARDAECPPPRYGGRS